MSESGTSRTLRDVRLESGMRSKADVRAKQKFDVRFLKASRKSRRVALLRWIVSLGPLAALVALHVGPPVRRASTNSARDGLPDHLEWHPDRSHAALASDPKISFGLKLRDSAGVGHVSIKARSITL
jgi:hypothetical protein